MKNRKLVLWSVAAIAAMLIAGLVVGMQLPETARLPIHWNVDGEPDGFAGKWSALFLPALFAAIVTGILAITARIEPMQQSVALSRGLLRAIWVGMIGVFWVTELVVISAALGWKLAVSRVILGAIGLLFVGIGDQLGKSRPMYMVGIRTPWTLADADVWIATHRLGGKLMVIAGAACCVMALAGVRSDVALLVGLGLLLAAAIVPVVYSYLLWRRLPGRPAR
ncbi:SdpI family protein [Sphingomonas crusticola]|uniref:SdpI family protein n=1 Tax=Sphingomonas crusticola TaxID=1697973 RepID=UPI000E2419A9|nr:SdpI family protein [Sphingomonas crusticola]